MAKPGNDPKDNKVLEFPKAKSFRKRLMDRTQDQRAVLGLSIVSVLVISIFLNEWIIKSQSKMDSMTSGREIASFDDRDSAENVAWEHDLAQRLSQEKAEAKSMMAEKPTLKDELVFGFLEGKYKTHINNSKIEGFDFTSAQAGDQPLVIREKAEFLKIFKTVFSLNYSKVELDHREGSMESYKLLSSLGKIVGEAHFDLDDRGRVLSFKLVQ